MPKLLSDEDEVLITQMVNKVLKNRANTPYRGPENIVDASPEVYIAKLPEDGLPAREDDVLGTAECEIFRIVANGSDFDLDGITLHGAVKLKKKVFNIYPIQVAFNEEAPYFVIHKDKYGKFVNEAPNVSVPGHHICKVPAGGIPARVGLVPGAALAEIWYLDSVSGDLTNTGLDEVIFNIYPVAVAFDAAVPYFQIDRSDYDGFWYNEAPSGGTAGPTGVPFKNDSGFTIPPGGCMRCVDAVNIGGIPHILTYRPNVQFDNFWLINGQTAVAHGGTSLGSFLTDLVGFVAIGSSETPGAASIRNWGPQPGSFELSENRLGFFPLSSGAYIINGQRCGYFKGRFISELLGKWYDTLLQNNKALFQPYAMQTADGKFGLTGGWDKIQAYDFWLQLNQEVKAGTKGKIIWYANSWVMDLTSCEVSNTQETFNAGRSGFSFGMNNQTALDFSPPSDNQSAIGYTPSFTPAAAAPVYGMPTGGAF